MEEYTIYYGLSESRVEEITLHFVSFPAHYWKQKHGELGADYDAAVEAGALADSSQAFLATRDDVVRHFTKVFGRDPVLERKSPGVFGKKHHQFINHVWADESMNVRLYVMSYVDDAALHSQLGGSILYAVRCTMKIHLSRF